MYMFINRLRLRHIVVFECVCEKIRLEVVYFMKQESRKKVYSIQKQHAVTKCTFGIDMLSVRYLGR